MKIKQTLARWTERRQRRAQLRELCSLDDHVLKDIGVRRFDLYAALRER